MTEEIKSETIEVSKTDFEAMQKSISDLQTEGQTSKETIANLEGKLSVTPPVAPSVSTTVPEPIDKEKFNEEMVSDPMAALDKYAAAKLGPIVNEQTKNQASANRKASEASNKEMYEKYGEEITTLETQVQPHLLAQPGAYDYLVKQVRANHIDDMVKEEVAKQMKANEDPNANADPALSGSENNRRVVTDPNTPNTTPLDEDQLKVMKGLGLSEEEYREFEDPNKELIIEAKE